MARDMAAQAASGTSISLDGHDARVALLTMLKAAGYDFTTPTPRTHRRVLGHPDKQIASCLRDVFGWSLPFERGLLDSDLFGALQAANALVSTDRGYVSALRASTLGADIFLHSAYPAKGDDAVFFGPDTYRFARFLAQHLKGEECPVAVDVGAGSGAGAVAAARLARIDRLILTDVNASALTLARANLEAAGLTAEFSLSEGCQAVPEQVDLIVANPPFIAGSGGRTYRDGGDMHGARLSLDWAVQGSQRLAPGGHMLLYTGVAMIDGQDPLRAALTETLAQAGWDLDYSEIDPDIFGEMLDQPAYQDADRIAAVGAVIRRR